MARRIFFWIAILSAIAAASFYILSIGVRFMGEDFHAQALYASWPYSVSIFGQSLGRSAILVFVLAIAAFNFQTLVEFTRVVLSFIAHPIQSVSELGTRARTFGLSKIAALFFLCAILPAAIGFLGFEVYVRAELVRQYHERDHIIVVKDNRLSASKLDQIVGYSQQTKHPRGLFKPEETLTTSFFKPNIDTSIGLKVTVRTNNLGYLSNFIYPDTTDEADFNIVVLGDSYTGSTTMSRPWVDTLQTLLRDSPTLATYLAGKELNVFNLGWPSAGFAHFREVFELHAAAFKPDLVLVNFIEADYPRLRDPLSRPGARGVLSGYVRGDLSPAPEDAIFIPILCDEPPIALRNPNCYQYWNFFVRPTFDVTGNRLLRAYDVIKDAFVNGKMWDITYSYGLERILGRIQNLEDYRQPRHFRFTDFDLNEMIDHAVTHLRAIKNAHPNVLLTLNPIHDDFKPGRETDKMTTILEHEAPDLQVIRMKSRLPDADAATAAAWYNIPYDGHMSTKGGELYARAIADLIVSRLTRD